MTVVYADVVFIVNGLINYFLLLCSAKICDVYVRRLRLALAAALGGAYAALVYIPALGFLSYPLIKLAAGALMALAAFGGLPRLLRASLIFFAVSAAFGGVVYAASLLGGLPRIDLRVLAVSFALCWAALTLLFRRTGRGVGRTARLELQNGGRRLEMTALVDTGNSLSDPLTGKPVAVAGLSELSPLFGGDTASALAGLSRQSAAEVLTGLGDRRFRLIPYKAVGVSGGLLLCFSPDSASVDGKRRDGLLVAISPNSVSDGGAYSALIGGE